MDRHTSDGPWIVGAGPQSLRNGRLRTNDDEHLAHPIGEWPRQRRRFFFSADPMAEPCASAALISLARGRRVSRRRDLYPTDHSASAGTGACILRSTLMRVMRTPSSHASVPLCSRLALSLACAPQLHPPNGLGALLEAAHDASHTCEGEGGDGVAGKRPEGGRAGRRRKGPAACRLRVPAGAERETTRRREGEG